MDEPGFIHLLKDILTASKIWQLGIKLFNKDLFIGLFCRHQFLTSLGIYEGARLLNLW